MNGGARLDGSEAGRRIASGFRPVGAVDAGEGPRIPRGLTATGAGGPQDGPAAPRLVR